MECSRVCWVGDALLWKDFGFSLLLNYTAFTACISFSWEFWFRTGAWESASPSLASLKICYPLNLFGVRLHSHCSPISSYCLWIQAGFLSFLTPLFLTLVPCFSSCIFHEFLFWLQACEARLWLPISSDHQRLVALTCFFAFGGSYRCHLGFLLLIETRSALTNVCVCVWNWRRQARVTQNPSDP